MMRFIVSKSIQFRFLVLAIACALMYFGMRELKNAQVDVFPEFAPPRVEIQVPSVGLSAKEVEELVTIPIEDALNGVEGLDVMRSKSVQSLSAINLIFKRGTDLLKARQLVAERLATVSPTLPSWTSPPVLMPALSSTSRFMKIGIASDTLSVRDLSMISYWKIRARLLRVPGVSNVMIYGERIKMYAVQVEPDKLVKHKVPLTVVQETIGDALDASLVKFSEGHFIGSGGFIDTPNQRMQVRYILPIVTPDDLSKVSLKGRPELKLTDIARVVEDSPPPIGDAIINDGPGILLIVEKFPWANTLDVTRGTDEALKEIAPGLKDVKIDAEIFRPATFIETSIGNLTNALVLGSILIVVLLFFFLFEWRTALISVTAIPLSLLTAGLVLDLRGETINVMILAGLIIAVGEVVDDAIIDIENIWRRLRQKRAEGSTQSLAGIILDASLEVRGAIVYATMMVIVVLSPVFFLEGLSGAFFRPLAMSFTIAILASMVVALTVTPALAYLLLRNAPLRDRYNPVVPWLQKSYRAVLSRIIPRPRYAYVAVGAVALLGLWIVPQLGRELLPEFKERDFLMHWLTKPGTSQPEMARITSRASVELRAVPGVRNFGAHIGQALLSDEPYGPYFGENWISVDPAVDYQKTVDKLQEVVDGYPGIYRDVQTYLKERIREVLTGAKQAVVVRIYGDDITELRKQADKVKVSLEGVQGLKSLSVEFQYPIAQIEVEVNLDAAQRYGVKPGDVRRTSGILLAGEEAGDIFRDGKAYDVNVWSTPETRHSIEDVKNLLIDTPNAGPVRLADLANVRVKATPNHIDREYQSRKIDVTANVAGRDLGSVAADVQNIVSQVAMPLGYRAEVLGEAAERSAASNRLLIYSLIAAAIVFALLQTTFGTWRLTVLAFVTLPMALAGGAIAAYYTGGVLSLGSLVGFLTVLGLSGRNAIMMISHFQHLEREEGEPFGPNLVLRGAVERISPIMMTALAMAFALVPMLVTGDIPGQEIEYPMALVIMGGLISATLVNLFVVPSLYLRFAKSLASRSADHGTLQPGAA
jgi:CzcA family heavy metal efflux pump